MVFQALSDGLQKGVVSSNFLTRLAGELESQRVKRIVNEVVKN